MWPEPAISLIPKEQLSAADAAAIIALCSQAFEEDYAPFMQAFEGSVHILARLEGALVSHALWLTRWLQIENGPLLRTAYVEGVATETAFRGRGLATMVMQRLATEIADFDIGALSPADTTLYTRLGWEFWQGPLHHRKDGKLIPDPDDEAVMILRLPQKPKLDLSRPISIEWREGEIW